MRGQAGVPARQCRDSGIRIKLIIIHYPIVKRDLGKQVGPPFIAGRNARLLFRKNRTISKLSQIPKATHMGSFSPNKTLL